MNILDHAPQGFAGVRVLGVDPNSAARSFKGRLDDVRIYSYALSETDIEVLRVGQAVTCEEGRGPKGPRAEKVQATVNDTT